MLTRVVTLALLLLPALAAADPIDTPPPTAHATEQHRFALAVNDPFGWAAHDFGVSAYAGVSPHVALRANVARYNFAARAVGEELAAELIDGDGIDSATMGESFDVGVGAVWYPRRLWSGLMLEAGLLRRAVHTHYEDDFGEGADDRHVRTYAGHALVGWSWLIKDRAFVGLAVGGSYGHATGTDVTQTFSFAEPMTTTSRHVSEDAGAAEWYLRFGAAF